MLAYSFLLFRKDFRPPVEQSEPVQPESAEVSIAEAEVGRPSIGAPDSQRCELQNSDRQVEDRIDSPVHPRRIRLRVEDIEPVFSFQHLFKRAAVCYSRIFCYSTKPDRGFKAISLWTQSVILIALVVGIAQAIANHGVEVRQSRMAFLAFLAMRVIHLVISMLSHLGDGPCARVFTKLVFACIALLNAALNISIIVILSSGYTGASAYRSEIIEASIMAFILEFVFWDLLIQPLLLASVVYSCCWEFPTRKWLPALA